MAKKASNASFSDLMQKYAVNKELNTVPLSVDALNQLWGGGITLGYMYSFWAEAGVGKSTLTLQIAKSFAKAGLKVLMIDVEKAINQHQSDAFGLTQYVEEGLIVVATVTNFGELEELVEAAAESEEFSLLVIDSVTAVSPITPAGLKVTDVRPGLRAQQESFVLNKMKDLLYKKKIASVVLFHARANINIMGGGTQPAVKQAGGFAAEHYPDVITKITSHGKIKDDEDSIIGVEITLLCTKNKFEKPFTPLRKKLIYGVGISKKIDMVDTAIDRGIIQQRGSFFIVPGGDNVRGRKNLYDLPAERLRSIQAALNESKEN